MKEDLFAVDSCLFSYRDGNDCPFTRDASYEVGSDFMDVGFFEQGDMVKMIVVFRGSDDWNDWLSNLTLDFDEEMFYGWFIKRYQQELSKGMSVWVLGHSRGGVLAQKFAREMTEGGRPPEKVITFGSPKIKNPRSHNYTHIRFVNGADSVPTLPPRFFFWGYGHRGQTRLLNKGRRWRRWFVISGALEDHFLEDYKEAIEYQWYK